MSQQENHFEQKFNNLLPKVISDYVDLPSKGLFYKNKINKVMLEYMTSYDEQYLLSENLIKNGTSFELLLKNKIKDPEFLENMSIDDLLIGDFDALLIFLRKYAYGTDYLVKVTDTNGMTFEDVVDLDKIKYKEPTNPDTSEGYFVFDLPTTKHQVVFKLLSYGDRKKLNERIMKRNNNSSTPLFETQERMISQIISIADETNRVFIEKYVKLMPPKDALELRKRMLDVEPSLDYNYEFVGKFTGDFFRQKITIGPEIFYPAARI
jgi:hypothetical protein